MWPVAEAVVQPGSAPSAEPDLDALIDLGLPSGDVPAPAPIAAESAPTTADAEPDFSALLESLDVDAEEPAPAKTAADAGFDEELLRDDYASVGSGVISTDAFLEDIEMEDLGFSGGLTDELSALTGAERRQPARPQASVNAIPDAAGALHRDARVDKDTVLKIIEGIKGL